MVQVSASQLIQQKAISKIAKDDCIEGIFNMSGRFEIKNLDCRGWTGDILNCVNKIWTTIFTLEDMYAFEEELQNKYPKNHNIRPKIRQQLQVLRDQGVIKFLENGRYQKIT